MAYVADDSYCATTDVQARCQMGTFADGGSATVPTLQEVLDFQAHRAGQLYAVLFDVMGTAAPGPASYGTTVDTTSDHGKALEAVLIRYNAIGAAIDALEAAGAGETPARSERISDLDTLWQRHEAAVRDAALMYQGVASRSATHISDGEITVASVTAREEDGLDFDGRTEW